LIGKRTLCDEQIGPKQKRPAIAQVERLAIHRTIRELEKERAIDRQSRTAHLLRGRVEIGQEPIALLDVTAAQIYVLRRAVFPWLLRLGANGRVVAIDGLKCRDLKPSCQ